MRIQRTGAERNRGSKSAEIRRSDFLIFDFAGYGIIRLEFTPNRGFDPDSTHLYQIDMRIDELADMIDKLDWSAKLVQLGEGSASSVNRLAESLRALALTLERSG